VDSLETGPGDTDLASNLVLQTSKSIFNGTELDRGRGRSLESSGMVVLVGWGRWAWDTGSEFTVLVLDWVESVLVVSEYTRVTRKTYITFTLVSVLEV
jgi:hypothetical protein